MNFLPGRRRRGKAAPPTVLKKPIASGGTCICAAACSKLCGLRIANQWIFRLPPPRALRGRGKGLATPCALAREPYPIILARCLSMSGDANAGAEA